MSVNIEHLWTTTEVCGRDCRLCTRDLHLAHMCLTIDGMPREMFTLWYCPACLERKL